MAALVATYLDESKEYAAHNFRVRHIYKAIADTIGNLKSGEFALHIDFSENYTVKVGHEVQSAHFGYSGQVVIHQGMSYGPNMKQAFATLSDDTRKTSDSVAAHILSVLRELKYDNVIDKVSSLYAYSSLLML